MTPEDLRLTAVGNGWIHAVEKLDQGCEISRRCGRPIRRPMRSVSDQMWHPTCACDACAGAIMIAVNNVLVATDFAETSQKILAEGI